MGAEKETPSAEDIRANKLTNTQVLCTLLRVLASMMLIPVQPKIIQTLAEDDAAWTYESYASTVQFSGALVQLALLPYAGALSDRLLGRKPPLLACGLMQFAYLVALKLASKQSLALTPLVGLSVVNVACSYVGMAITSAALGDAWAHAPGKLAGASGKLGGVAFGVGMLFGPALGSILAAKAPGGSQATLHAAMLLSGCAIAAQAFLAAESAPVALNRGRGGNGDDDDTPSFLKSLSGALVGVNPLAGLQLVFFGGGPRFRALGAVGLLNG